MVKIKVSYENKEELERVLKHFKGHIKKWKVSNNEVGRFKKAYIELSNEPRENPEKSH